jgi:hypothetical protein
MAPAPRFGQVLFGTVAVLTAASGALLSWGAKLTKSCDIGIVAGLPVMAGAGLCYLAWRRKAGTATG